MKHKHSKSRSAKPVKLQSAFISSQWTTQLDSLKPEELYLLNYSLGVFLYWWMGDPTEGTIQNLRETIPLLNELVNFDMVLKRVKSLDSFERGQFGVKIKTFFPELIKIHQTCATRIEGLSQGVYKAECWLTAIARHAGANADLEAAIYLASRGVRNPIDVDVLKDMWHSRICRDIEHGGPIGKVPQAVLERAHSHTISLAEAAEVLCLHQELPRFFAFRDEEDDFIDATMFRAVEWLGITGFDPWLKSFVSALSLGPQYGIDNPSAAGWWLFYWCRSDLALRMAERHGLESWFWALVNGQLEREKPWRVMAWGDKNPRKRDYLPLAGIILFLWHRIKPSNMKEEILQHATDLLYQTQLRCGGWPLFMDDSEPDLLSTCFAIHGLALHRPQGWEQLAKRASEWLTKQQQAGGFWDIAGGPTVMLTILALDALVLARDGKEVTFKLDNRNEIAVEHIEPEKSGEGGYADIDPTYQYEKEDWYQTNVPTTISVPLSRTRKTTRPMLAIVVATETELRQTLRVLKPLQKRRRIWKVMHGHDTYYLGRFGTFESVVTLSSMGSEGMTGSTLSVDAVIHEWDPKVVILLGIAYGASRNKHLPADVLVAEYLIPFERQRIGNEPMFRNPIPPSSPVLVNRFRNALGWVFHRPDGTRCAKHVGSVLSGEKLIDNRDFKDNLLYQYPNAIGGEMEGTGLWSAAQRARKEWIIVKGVCDWADGYKHDSYQEMAAASAVSLCEHVFSDPHALDGV